MMPAKLVLLWIVLNQASPSAQSIYLIAHKSVTLKASEVRDVYLGDREFDGNVHITPVENASVSTTFVVKVLNIEPDRYAKLWLKKSFREGLTPPQRRASDSEVSAFVSRMQGAVGYVSSPPQTGDVQVIAKF
jgi:hypothetical protein